MFKKILSRTASIFITLLWIFSWVIGVFVSLALIAKQLRVIFIYKGGLCEMVKSFGPHIINLETGEGFDPALLTALKTIGLIYLLFLFIYVLNILKKSLSNLYHPVEGKSWRQLLWDKPLFIYGGFFSIVLLVTPFLGLVCNDIPFVMKPLVLIEESNGPFVNNARYEEYKIRIYYRLFVPQRKFIGEEIHLIDSRGNTVSKIEYPYPPQFNETVIVDLDNDGLKEVVVSPWTLNIWVVNERGEFEDKSRAEEGFQLVRDKDEYIFEKKISLKEKDRKKFMWSRDKGFLEIPTS